MKRNKGWRIKISAGILMLFVGILTVAGCRQEEDVTEIDVTEAPVSEETDGTTADDTEVSLISQAELLELYEDYITEKASDASYEGGKWGLYDVNQDGMDELIIKAPYLLQVVQYQDGELTSIYQDGYSKLLANGMIRYYRLGGESYHERYTFFVPEDTIYEESLTLERYDTNEYVPYKKIYDEDDRYEVTEKMDSTIVSMEEWLDTLDEYLEYTEAEIEFQGIVEGAVSELDYETEMEAYQAFLNGECGIVLSDSYADEIEYMAPHFAEGEAYYLCDILDSLNNEAWHGNRTDDYEHRYTNFGTDISYAYMDCGNDGRKELAVQIVKHVGVERFETTYVIQYKEKQLYLCYGIDAWPRKSVILNQYGYIWAGGSNGAANHSGVEEILDSECIPHMVMEWQGIHGAVNDFFYDYPTITQMFEVKQEWMDAYEVSNGKNNYPLEKLYLSICVIDDKDYYQYSLNNDEEGNQIAFIESCEEAGIHFCSEEEINSLIEAKRGEFNAVDLAETDEMEWTNMIPEDEAAD